MMKRYLKRSVTGFHKKIYIPLNIAEINRGNILNNVRVFQQLNPTFKIMAVLKSNGYGHGLIQVASVLNAANIDFIAVDGYFEANRIRGVTRHRILVMGYILPDNIRLLDNKKCSFVVQDKKGLAALGSLGKKFRIHMEINTGMNRLGLQPEEIEGYLDTLAQYPDLRLEGIMTHLADADNSDGSYTDMQSKRFDETVELIQSRGYYPTYIHIAQSAGSTQCRSAQANSCRIGIGLYGISPLDKKDKRYLLLNELKPVLELKSTIIKVLDLKAGERVSYNGIYKTEQSTRIGILPLGYYEWVPRELSDKGFVTAGDYVLPIRGRVCMNHTMIDLTGTGLMSGDRVEVISANKDAINSIQSIASQYGLFNYELLTRLSESVRREIV